MDRNETEAMDAEEAGKEMLPVVDCVGRKDLGNRIYVQDESEIPW